MGLLVADPDREEGVEGMSADEIYGETIPFPLVKVILGILTIFTALMLFLLIYQLAIGPVGNRPAPAWFYLLMFLFLAGITAFVSNFKKLTTRITSTLITVSFGRMKKTVPWGNVEDCYLDDASTLRYGGWGIRIARVKGRWRHMYSVAGYPGVVLKLRQGRFREFVFSARDSEKILKIVEQQIGEAK